MDTDYRAWIYGKMYYFGQLGLIGWKSDTTKLMKLTSFKDKNGKGIYEGDIIEGGDNSGKTERVEVRRVKKEFIGGDSNDLHLRIPDWTQYEVIGNIYENPELLKT